LLLLAGDSIRETAETPVVPVVQAVPPPPSVLLLPRFPKTQATQTDFTLLEEDQEKEEEQEEVGKKEEEKSRSKGRVWSWFRGLVGFILILLLTLSLLAEVEYEGRLYRPITYYPLR
jgi:hypothetical protein